MKVKMKEAGLEVSSDSSEEENKVPEEQKSGE